MYCIKDALYKFTLYASLAVLPFLAAENLSASDSTQPNVSQDSQLIAYRGHGGHGGRYWGGRGHGSYGRYWGGGHGSYGRHWGGDRWQGRYWGGGYPYSYSGYYPYSYGYWPYSGYNSYYYYPYSNSYPYVGYPLFNIGIGI